MNPLVPNKITLTVHDGRIFCTSLQVAEHFGKRHDDVLKAIRNLECSKEFRLRNFAESSYINAQNKEQPMVEMTRDGFSFLAMGFTGKEAAAWKEKYIAAFNAMERHIRENLEETLRIQKAYIAELTASPKVRAREKEKILKSEINKRAYKIGQRVENLVKEALGIVLEERGLTVEQIREFTPPLLADYFERMDRENLERYRLLNREADHG